ASRVRSGPWAPALSVIVTDVRHVRHARAAAPLPSRTGRCGPEPLRGRNQTAAFLGRSAEQIGVRWPRTRSWQCETEFRPVGIGPDEIQPAAMRFGDPAPNGQPKSGTRGRIALFSRARLVGAEEAIEDVWLRLQRNAGTFVRHRDVVLV